MADEAYCPFQDNTPPCGKELCRIWSGTDCSFPVVAFKMINASVPPYASSIIQEYACYQDMDGNGKIFGQDFRFIVEKTCPPTILGIQKSPDFDQTLKEIHWVDLFDWKMKGGPDPLA